MTVRSPRRSPVVPITAPTFAPPSHAAFYRKIAYTFFGLTALILAGILWLSSVEATVDVRVRRTPVRGDDLVEITTRPSGAAQIPGRVLHLPLRKTQEFDVRGVAATAVASSSLPVTAPAVPPTTTASSTPATPSENAFAVGQVTVTNNYSKPQTLVERTRLLTADGKLYRLDRRITVPAGGKETVSVTADQPGSSFAIAPAKFTIPGLWIDLQKLIFAESSAAFAVRASGAVSNAPVVPPPAALPAVPAPVGERKIVTQQNIGDAYQALMDQPIEQAKRTLAASVTDPRLNGAAYFVNTTAKSTTVRAGQAASSFIAQVDIEVTGVFYSAEDMQGLIRSRLRERLPDGQEFLPFKDQDFVYTLESVDKGDESARLRVITSAEYRLTANTPALQPGAIAGKSKDEAERALKAIDGVESVEITLHPGWIGKVPRLTDHIKMEVK